MGKTVVVLGLLALVLLLISPVGSEAIWSGKKEPATAGEAAKEYAKDAIRSTADTAANVGESVKQTADAAFESTVNSAKTVTGGRSDRTSGGPTGAAYRDRAGNYVADTVSAAQRAAADAAASTTDTVTETTQTARDAAARAYDATADAVGSARDRVWGQPEEPTYTQRATDAARRAGENVRDGASRAYDSATGGWGYGRNEDDRGVYEKARDATARAGQATRDSTYRALGYEAPADKGYMSQAYDSVRDSSSDAYEAGKNRLGKIVEVLGWHRAPEDERTTNHLGKYYSPYDVVVGNTRYVWHQKPDEPESYYQSAKNSAGRAAQTVADKAQEGVDAVYDTAGRTKDMTVERASQSAMAVRDMAGRTGESVSGYNQKSMEAINARAAALEKRMEKPGFFRRLWRFLHLLVWGVALGTAVWMTFFSARILEQNMPRDQFRTVQTKMFPSYLRFLNAGEGVLAFLYTFRSGSSIWQIFSLLVLFGTSAYNAYVLEPQTTKIYLERLKLEKEEGRGLSDAAADNANDELAERNKKFRELHGFSASLNLLSLAGLTYHAWNMVSTLYA